MDPYTKEQPKYLRLASELRRTIETGTLPPGTPLPSEHQLAERHGMSRPTVVRALDILRRDGLVESHQGRGTYVRATRARTAEEELARLRDWLTAHHPDRMTDDTSPVDVAITLLDAR